MTDYRKLYFAVWFSILALYAGLAPDIYPNLTIGVLGIVLGLPLVAYILASAVPQPRLRQIYASNTIYERRLWQLFLLWAGLSVISLAAGGPLPILAIGSNSYAEFGISGIGGLQNSIALIVVPLLYLQYRTTKNTRFALVLIVILLWQVATFRRGMLVTFIFQIAVMAHISQGRKLGIRDFILAASVVVIFGVIGDYRGLPNPYIALFDGWKYSLLSNLPSGFTWVYVYATSGVSNLANNYRDLPGCGEYFYPFNTVLPTLLRGESSCNYELYDTSLNVGSVFSGLMMSGYVAATIYLTCLIYLYARVHAKVKKFSSATSISAYSVILVGILFSPFSDLIFLPTYVLAIVILSFMPAPWPDNDVRHDRGGR